MLYPVCCPHCRGSIGDKVEIWQQLRPTNRHDTHNEQGVSAQEILEAIGAKNACCKKILRTCNVLIHMLNQYRRPQISSK